MDTLQQIIVKKDKYIILLLFILGLLLRVSGIFNIVLAGDNLLHWKIAGLIAENGIFPLLGPKASVNPGFDLGPAYYYLLAIPYWIGQGNFKIAVVFFSILNSFSIPLLYYVSKRWFSKIKSLQITALFTFSAYLISVQNFPWNPYILPFFIILSLFFINKVNKKKYLYFALLALSYSVCLQAHATAVFLLPVFIYLLPYKKIPLKHYLTAAVVFLIANFPWIYVNFTSGFSQLTAALSIFEAGKIEVCSFSGWLLNHGNGESCFSYFRNTLFSFRFITMSIFDTRNILVVFISLFLIGLYFLKEKMKEKKFLMVWLFVPMFLFLFYSSFIYLHYFLILTPLPFYLFVVLLSKLERFKKRDALLINIIIISVILLNIVQYLYSLRLLRG